MQTSSAVVAPESKDHDNHSERSETGFSQITHMDLMPCEKSQWVLGRRPA